jgi:hypothetical protein
MPGERGWKLLLGIHIERNGERDNGNCKERPSTHGVPPLNRVRQIICDRRDDSNLLDYPEATREVRMA